MALAGKPRARTAFGLLTIMVACALVMLMLRVGKPDTFWWWAQAMPFGAWILGPAVVPYLLARRFSTGRWVTGAMTLFLVVSSAWSAGVYHHAFFVSTASTAALAFVFVPLCQWLALGCVATLCLIAAKVARRRSVARDAIR